jgi:hypothetical protein
MVFFEAAQLVRFQQKKRCLHSGKQRGAEDQNGDNTQHNGQSRRTHFCETKLRAPWVPFRVRRTGQGTRRPSEELVVGGLLIL